MTAISPIAPYYGRTVTVAATTTDSSTPIAVNNRATVSRQLLISNVGAQTVFVRCAVTADSTAASAADLPIIAQSQRVITVSITEAFNIHVICPNVAGSTVYLTPCDGF